MSTITATLFLTGALVWGRDDLHQQALAYQQAIGKVPPGVLLTETLALSFPGGCDRIGEQWELILPDGAVRGPLWVHDCADGADALWNEAQGRVAEVCHSQALALVYPLNRFILPRDGPLSGVRVQPYLPPWPERVPRVVQREMREEASDNG